MFFKKISLINFRNYEKLYLELNPHLNVFIGNNAQGKTNILESIYVLGITKSHRTSNDTNMIKQNNKYSKIKGIIKKENNNLDDEIEIILSNNGKKALKNKTHIKKMSDYISNVNIIMFNPEDLELVKGSPTLRRKFLNIEIAQINNKYLKDLNEYNKILKIRNNLLKKYQKEPINNEYLEIITKQLIKIAIEIVKYRNQFIDNINEYFALIYKDLTKKDDLFIQYNSFFDVKDLKKEDVIEKLLKKYQKNLNYEIFLGMTTQGVHREDFSFICKEGNLCDFGSQGWQRIAVLCLKLSEIEIFKKLTGESPILVLDDIFSELDNERKNLLIKYINNNLQVFISATDIEQIDKKILVNANVNYIKNGYIIKKEVF